MHKKGSYWFNCWRYTDTSAHLAPWFVPSFILRAIRAGRLRKLWNFKIEVTTATYDLKFAVEGDWIVQEGNFYEVYSNEDFVKLFSNGTT